MTTDTLSPEETIKDLKLDNTVIIDVREPEEYKQEHIPGALNMPLSTLQTCALKYFNHKKRYVLQCLSGKRATEAFELLTTDSGSKDMTLTVLEGGISGWKKAGLETVLSSEKELPVMRIVQMVAGICVLLGTISGLTLHPAFFGIPIFFGAGLTFAGLSGWCGMALAIQKLRAVVKKSSNR